MALTLTQLTGTVDLPNGETPSHGRIRFVFSQWGKNGGNIFVPGPVEFALSAAGALVNCFVQSTEELDGVLAQPTVIYWSFQTGREVQVPLPLIQIPTAGPVALASLLLIPAPTPTVPDLLAQTLAATAVATGAATTSSAAAASAATYAQVNFATHAAALAYVAGGGTFSSGRLYSIAGAMFVGRTGATYVPGLPGLTPLPVGLTLRNNTGHYVHVAIGQSWPIGADAYTTGALWAVNSKVQVWSPNGSGAWGAPVQYQTPFNINGSVSWPVELLNRLSEEWPLNTRLYLNAKGGASITEWVGTTANRAKTVGNRPEWMKLAAMIAAGGSLPDSLSLHQCAGDHSTMNVDTWVSEVAYFISDLEAEGIITKDTPILVVEAPHPNSRGSSNGVSQNSYRTNMMVHGLRALGDPRIRIVGTRGLPAPYETIPGGDTFAAHFSDAGSRRLGRERAYDVLMSAMAGATEPPTDAGVDRIKDEFGVPGFHLRRTQLIDGVSYNVTAVNFNGVIEANPGSTIVLPDLTNTAFNTSGAIAGDHGAGFTFIPRAAGTYTFNAAGAVTMIGCGPFSSGALSTFSYVVGANEADIPVFFKWSDGANWQFWPLGQVGPRPMKWVSSIDLPSLAAGATVTVTLPVPGVPVGTPLQVGRPSAWRAWSLAITDVYVATVGVLSIEVTNNSGITRDVGNVGIIVTGVV